ncbi:hypothetical protein [Iodidimonas gelatinilytica]|uniref:hypothetical protein n=1 Tax=Iodidimonas gelatinilytica TaxID=1236966 RepID=UPI001230C81D|nr:hypothetical protein [Iodidimonas gelatinilytica]
MIIATHTKRSEAHFLTMAGDEAVAFMPPMTARFLPSLFSQTLLVGITVVVLFSTIMGMPS